MSSDEPNNDDEYEDHNPQPEYEHHNNESIELVWTKRRHKIRQLAKEFAESTKEDRRNE